MSTTPLTHPAGKSSRSHVAHPIARALLVLLIVLVAVVALLAGVIVTTLGITGLELHAHGTAGRLSRGVRHLLTSAFATGVRV